MKPGYKTTEFWLATMVTLLNAVVASGVVQTGSPWAQVVALIGGTVIPLVYNFLRNAQKIEAMPIPSTGLPPFTSNMNTAEVQEWINRNNMVSAIAAKPVDPIAHLR